MREHALKRLFLLAALVVAPIALLGVFGGVAAADTVSPNPITFESSQGYTQTSINGQQGWSDTGGYDAQVVATTVPGLGEQSLQISDATTSGSFGDQTFAPGLTQPASETTYPYFTASFSIDTATATPNDGLHMSVSPDNGQGGRMSYLRFEYHASDGKVHAFFDDSNQSSYCSPAGCANFTETDIAQFAPDTVHTFTFAINLVPGTNSDGSPNDVVNIYEDGALIHTGTTWEGYYRYDPESGPATPPAIGTLLFREAGSANSSDLGKGYLIDNVSMSSSACTPTGLMRDGINLTAKVWNPSSAVAGTVDATGCNIGIYYGDGKSGSVGTADISGANYYGVVADGAAVNITGATIHDIGEEPFNGSQHGIDVLYTTVHQDGSPTHHSATGTLSGSTISHYQKNGVVVSGSHASVTIKNNTVTGAGPVPYIAQNGIEIASGASASVTGNTVSGNWYTGPTYTACGLLFIQAGGVKQSANTLFANQTNLCNAGRGGGNFKP